MSGVEEQDLPGLDATAGKLQRVLEVAAVARSFLNSFENPNLPLQLFHAIVELTIKLGEQGVPADKLEFDSIDLSDYMISHFHSSKRFDSQNKAKRTEWITDQWKKLSRQLPEFEQGLIQHAARMQHRFTPNPVKQESIGGRGNKTLYRLACLPISDIDEVTHESSLTPHTKDPREPVIPEAEHITYTVARAKKLPPWARWLDHLEISGRTKLVFACLMAPGYALTCAWAILAFLTLSRHWLNQPIQPWQVMAFYPGIWIILPIVIFGMPFWRLSTHKIIPSPFLVTLFQSVTEDLFLELSRTDGCHRIDPDKPRSIRLVSYSARCPVCNGLVSIEGGGWKYPGRLIGRCYESPREHVWSFDHVTLSGRRLH